MEIDVLKHFTGFRLSGYTDVDVNINKKNDSCRVYWIITGGQDKIVLAIQGGNYEEELTSNELMQIAAGELNLIESACERYVINTTFDFLSHKWFLKK